MMYRNSLIAAAGVVAIASTASAVTVLGFGPGGLIPDRPDFANSGPGLLTTTITITENVQITDVQVDLNLLTHTYIGDLIVTLTHNSSGSSVDLFNRVGRTGGGGFGDSSNLDGFYAFGDSAAGDLWSTAASLTSTTDVIPSGSYFPTGVDGALTSLISAFGGESTMGLWTLTISDNAGGDTGSLGVGGAPRGFSGWGLTLTGQIIPAPTAAGLGLTGFFGLGARRRRRSA